MQDSHWTHLYRGSPLQEPGSPRHQQIAAAVEQQLRDVGQRVLLLGVNPPLGRLGSDLTAVDRNESVIRVRWPGDAPSRRVIVADWLQLPFPECSFSACIGDGSTNALRDLESARSLYRSVLRVLRAGGRFVSRVYLTPDLGETVADVVRAACQGQCRSFLYFKFRLGMAIATEQSDPSVRVQSIHAAFNAHFPDRSRLADITGWSRPEVDKIDLYASSPEIYTFPTRQQCLSSIPSGFAHIRFVGAGSYELAERCPLLVMEKA